MGILNRFKDNASQLIVNKLLSNKQITAGTSVPYQVDVGIQGVSTSEQGKQAVYPQWFYSSNLGQPRRYDPNTLRDFAQSSWVQMVLNAFKKEISTIEWRIVPINEEDKEPLKDDIKFVTDKLMNINDNHQTINDINSEVITDIGEIDAGVLNYVYSGDSYTIGDVPIYNNEGTIIETKEGVILKPFGQRTLNQVKSVDGASMLKQVDIYKNLLNYYQWSFKHPNTGPIRFEPEEVAYLQMNKKSYSIYGFSPVQSIQQEIEVLMEGTRYNKDLFKNNAIPRTIVSLPKLATDKLKKIKRAWEANYKGKPHQVGFVNWGLDGIKSLAATNRDLEWLEGQKWYFKIVFAAFGVSPTEAGFFENANKSNDEGQARVTVRNAIKPHLALFENIHTMRTIPEILQKEVTGLKFQYFPKDHAEQKIKFEQNMEEIDKGVITINEYRKANGKEPVEWGDEPINKAPEPNNPDDNPDNMKDKDKDKDKNKQDQEKQLRAEIYKKDFGRFLDGRNSHS